MAWNSNFFGAPTNYGGLLADEEMKRARQAGLLGFGASLLQASGPSTTPVGLGQAFGQAALQGQSAQSQATHDALNAVLLKKQLTQKEKKDLVAVIGADGKPQYVDASKAEGMQPYSLASQGLGSEFLQRYTDYAAREKSAGHEPVNPLQYARLYTDATTQQTGTVKDVGAVPTLVTTKGPSMGAQQPLTTLPTEAQGKATVAGAEAGAKTTATATAENKMALGSNLDEIEKMKSNVKGLLAAPGFDAIYGASSIADPRNYIRGTDAADAQAKRDQLSAESFAITIQKMRGLGQLSNAEGEKVTAAYTRAVNPRISEEEARKAWGEVQGYLNIAERRAKEKAGAPAEPPTDIQSAAKAELERRRAGRK